MAADEPEHASLDDIAEKLDEAATAVRSDRWWRRVVVVAVVALAIAVGVLVGRDVAREHRTKQIKENTTLVACVLAPFFSDRPLTAVEQRAAARYCLDQNGIRLPAVVVPTSTTSTTSG